MSAVNGKRLLTKKYASWRVLQAPGAWAQVYIDRYKQLNNFSGAIVFPEQVLGVQGSVFKVNFERNSHRAGINITPYPSVGLFCFTSSLGSRQLLTPEDVYEFEHNNQERADLNMLKLAADQSTSDFANGLLFTNKRSAIRWSTLYFERTLS